VVGIHLPEVLQIPERGAKLRSNQEAVEMRYEENPQTPGTGFPAYLESANPALSTFSRLLLLSRSETIKASSRATHYILDLPTDSSYEAFLFCCLPNVGSGCN
jgi:hypothetical protein